jgi:hypothetical protein
MSKVIGTVIAVAFTVVGAVIGGPIGAAIGSMIGSLVSRAIMPKGAGKNRAAASAAQVQIGETPREALVGEGSTAGSLVDAFNYGGKYGTDWEVMVLDLFDHRCSALVGFYVNDTYVAFAGDGMVAGYNNQLQVYWRPGTETQTVPAILTANGPGWTANDNGAGVCYVVVAYKADEADAKNPIWPGGRPRFQWIVRGALCYDPRKDSTVGGSGAHRIDVPATWEYSDNPIVTRYKWVRGFYACDRVDQPEQLLIGRGLSVVEAPPANVFARANLCDEMVGGEKRYRVGGAISAAEPFIEVEEDFATACAGTIVQPQGCVEIDPGEARAIVATFTDDDLIVGSRVRWNNRILSTSSDEWINTVVATYIEPTQKWAEHAAPVRRDTADIAADRMPRERKLMLGFVTWVKQAQRCAEIVRRLGRLPGRGEVTLPPRFCEIEEGDWVQWQSARRFGGATLTLQVLSWGSNEKWHHTIQFRQISASVFSDTAPLDDGSIAAPTPVPPVIGAPAPGAWTLAAGHLDAGGVATPALIVTGATDDTQARFVRMEYVLGAAVPGPGTAWTDAGVTGPDVTRREFSVAAGGTYYVAVSYVVDGEQGDRRVLGPVTAGALTLPDGTPIEDREPTDRSPAPPLELPRGTVWFDDGGHPYRFGFRKWTSNGAAWTSNGSDWLGGGYEDVQDQVAVDALDLAETATATADAAKADAISAQSKIAAIVADGTLDKSEKPDVVLRYNAMLSEQPGIQNNAVYYAITTEKTAYDAAVAALVAYLTGLAPAYSDYATDTVIDRVVFNATFKAFYDARQTLLDRIAVEAGRSTATMTLAPAQSILCDYLGAPKAGQLSRLLINGRKRGNAVVDAVATWAATFPASVTGTIDTTSANTDRGDITITAFNGAAGSVDIPVSSTHDGLTINNKISITPVLDPPPPAPPPSGSVPTSAQSSDDQTNTTNAYLSSGVIIGPVRAPASGQIKLEAILSYTRMSNGENNAYGKWGYSTSGSGPFTDAPAGEVISSFNCLRLRYFDPDEIYVEPGALSVVQTLTGLTSGTDYYFEFRPRKGTNFSGVSTTTCVFTGLKKATQA